MTLYDYLRTEIRATSCRSAWARGVNAYALELIDDLAERAAEIGRDPVTADELNSWLLRGARDWRHYSYGGCALCYNVDIARRLCSASELQRNRNGERNPNRCETWLDVQARALYQAAHVIGRLYSAYCA